MSAPHAEQLVHEYLGRLQSELGQLPPARREEILDEISRHIAEARAQLHEESDADVHNLLDRVGDPAELAAAALDGTTEVGTPVEKRHVGAVEILALVLTPLIWPAGVILLWLSPAWSARDKLIGTLVPPGGYLFVFFLPALLLWDTVTTTCGGGTDSNGNTYQPCTGPWALPGWLQAPIAIGEVAILLLILLLPLLTALYLVRQLNRWRASPA